MHETQEMFGKFLNFADRTKRFLKKDNQIAMISAQ